MTIPSSSATAVVPGEVPPKRYPPKVTSVWSLPESSVATIAVPSKFKLVLAVRFDPAFCTVCLEPDADASSAKTNVPDADL